MLTIYAEKPSVARTIIKAINEGKETHNDGYSIIEYKGEPCNVTWGIGHLCELKQAVDYNPDYKNWKNLPLPFIPEKYETKFKEETIKQAKIVGELFKKSSLIINATDFDREGELIFRYLMDTLHCKVPFKRLCLKSLEISAIKEAFNNLLSPADVANIAYAAKARSIADFLIGSNATVALTLGFSNSGVLSVGRVQTPTLNILVEREKEIRKFKSQKYYEIIGEFTDLKDGSVKYKGTLEGDKIFDKSTANEICKTACNANASVLSVDKKQATKELPYLYNLSSLQMDANSIYGFSLDKTLKIAQELYEKGFTTYPRTDSIYLTNDMIKTVDRILASLKSTPQYSSLLSETKIKNIPHWFNDKKVTSHTAIIPTNNTPSGLSPDSEKIYDLICRSVIMMTYDDAKVEYTTVKTQADKYIFISKGTTVIDKQWLNVSLTPLKETILPKIVQGSSVNGKYTVTEKETTPPKRYTDKTLLSAMLNAGKYVEDDELKKILASDSVKGIGTEATRAGILNTLIARGYVQRVKKTLIPTDRGIFLIDTIPIEEIKSPAYTAMWEKRLTLIEKGEDSYSSFVNDIIAQTKDWCAKLNECAHISSEKAPSAFSTTTKENLICPLCGEKLHKLSSGWGCTGYKKGCKFFIGKIAGKVLSDTQINALLTKGRTNKINGFKSKAGKNFSAVLILDKATGKISFDFS